METITSRNNETVKEIVKLSTSGAHRRETGLFIAEGEKAVREALLAGAPIKTVLYTKNAGEKYRDTVQKVSANSQHVYEISGEVSQKISDTKSTQGIFCVCGVIDKGITIDKIDNNGRVILLENIQDPGNMGTILRTALALSIDAVLVAGGCDIYSPKVIRATAGTVFKSPFCYISSCAEAVQTLKKRGFKTFASVPSNQSAKLLGQFSLGSGCAVVIGNEGAGVEMATQQCCDDLLTIPMAGNAESLNAAVAASVIMWEMSKDGAFGG